MQHGDIDNGPGNPLIYVVWEGLIAVPSREYSPTKFRRRMRFRNPSRALDLYTTNEAAVRQIWELWEQDQGIAVVTLLGSRIGPALVERLVDDAVPYDRVISTTVSHLASEIALAPDVLHIVDPDPRHRFTYGSKGRTVAPYDAAMIGRLL
jgi:hypothetical protein